MTLNHLKEFTKLQTYPLNKQKKFFRYIKPCYQNSLRRYCKILAKAKKIKLPYKYKKKLKPHRKLIRDIANPKISGKKSRIFRKFLVKRLKGGFLTALLPILASIIPSIINAIR